MLFMVRKFRTVDKLLINFDNLSFYLGKIFLKYIITNRDRYHEYKSTPVDCGSCSLIAKCSESKEKKANSATFAGR